MKNERMNIERVKEKSEKEKRERERERETLLKFFN